MLKYILHLIGGNVIYYKDENITIRPIRLNDASAIYYEVLAQNWHPNKYTYEKYS